MLSQVTEAVLAVTVLGVNLQLAKEEVEDDAGVTLFGLSTEGLGCKENEAQLHRELGGEGGEFTGTRGNTIWGVTATVTGFWCIMSFIKRNM